MISDRTQIPTGAGYALANRVVTSRILPAVGDSIDFGLYRDASTPTEAGKAYRAAG